jgi:hypothetical protein
MELREKIVNILDINNLDFGTSIMEKDFLILHGSPILALDSAVRKYK